MIRLLVVLTLLGSFTAAIAKNSPVAPDPELTPGVLCNEDDPDFWRVFRYGDESVAICKRNVPTSMKYRVVIRYGIDKRKRKQYKIDHYIPLNIGGSNDIRNLFPIDKKVMGVYERAEWPIYQAMRKKKYTPSEAVDFVTSWKSNSYDPYWVLSNEGELRYLEELYPNYHTN